MSTIGETPEKSRLLTVAVKARTFIKTSLSDTTVKSRSDELAEFWEKVRGLGFSSQFNATIPPKKLNAVSCLFILDLWVTKLLKKCFLKIVEDHNKHFRTFGKSCQHFLKK
jgi:hypothetical protein